MSQLCCFYSDMTCIYNNNLPKCQNCVVSIVIWTVYNNNLAKYLNCVVSMVIWPVHNNKKPIKVRDKCPNCVVSNDQCFYIPWWSLETSLIIYKYIRYNWRTELSDCCPKCHRKMGVFGAILPGQPSFGNLDSHSQSCLLVRGAYSYCPSALKGIELEIKHHKHQSSITSR